MAVTDVVKVVSAFIFLISPLYAQKPYPADIKAELKALVAYAGDVVSNAREGSPLSSILQDVLDLQNVSLNLLARLSSEEKCEVQSVIKMAAAGIGSHEVLSVMLAEGYLGLLSARLGLALAFVNRVAHQFEEKLSLSSDVGPELTAIVFGTNTTASVIIRADETIRQKMFPVKRGNKPEGVQQLPRGFDIRNGVVLWKDAAGEHTIKVPVWRRAPPSGGHHVSVRSPDNWTGGLNGSGSLSSGSVSGNVDWTSNNGRFTAGVNGGVTWGSGGVQPNVGVSVTFRF